ncbi:MAG: hypothetical protein E4G89_05795 [Methanothrix sp.]|nr:MAG: hypothetical protein E4G89_05795 [Methanothrix sp.]
MAQTVDGRLFVLAGAPCFESRRPCSMAIGSRPRAWGRLAGKLPRAGRRPTRASEPGRTGSRNHFLSPVDV